ncbi:DUF1127 domain-containing protein [Amaricoccus tamworthensis]|uniref:DUF1127 domain-containing protein n=1 Tax=Amaricoccus tamworthensis TaxID=57002 RepID=UPI003C7E46B3
MAVLHTNHPVPFGAITLHRIIHLVDQVYLTIRFWRRSNAARKALRGLSDAQLTDIGLHRWQVEQTAGFLRR